MQPSFLIAVYLPKHQVPLLLCACNLYIIPKSEALGPGIFTEMKTKSSPAAEGGGGVNESKP